MGSPCHLSWWTSHPQWVLVVGGPKCRPLLHKNAEGEERIAMMAAEAGPAGAELLGHEVGCAGLRCQPAGLDWHVIVRAFRLTVTNDRCSALPIHMYL